MLLSKQFSHCIFFCCSTILKIQILVTLHFVYSIVTHLRLLFREQIVNNFVVVHLPNFDVTNSDIFVVIFEVDKQWKKSIFCSGNNIGFATNNQMPKKKTKQIKINK